MFRGDGNYLLGNVSRECSYGEYPVVLREETTAVLRDIKARNGWQPGDTVVFLNQQGRYDTVRISRPMR